MNSITAAQSIGTTYYRITKDALISAFEDDNNIVMQYVAQEYGFDGFDTESMWGSYLDVADDTFYYCDTDGKSIEIDGEEIEPEDALEDIGADILSEAGYVVDASDDNIRRIFTHYELTINVDDVGTALIADEQYDFLMVLSALNDLDLLDNVLS